MSAGAVFLLFVFAAMILAIVRGIPAWLAVGGMPLAIALGASAFGQFDPAFLAAFPARVFGTMANPLFIAVPLFVLTGVLMERSGLSRSMLDAAARIAGGGARSLTLSVLAISVLIAATTGVVGATIVMLGLIAWPSLTEAGVPKRFATGLILASGTLGQIIPPSIALIVLSDQISNAWFETERARGNFAPDPVTVGDLFAGALVPGLVLAALYAAYAMARLGNGTPNDAARGMKNGAGKAGSQRASVLWLLAPLLLIMAVLGSILAGIATPTEAAAAGAAGTIAMVLGGRGRDWRERMAILLRSLRETVTITGVIFAIVIAASMLSLVFRGFGGDQLFQSMAAHLPGGRWSALIIVMLAIFLMGFVMEFVEIVFIAVPVAGPVLMGLGFDPVWLGVLIAMNLQTSFLTPPFGVALFYFRSVAPKELPDSEIQLSVIPFVLLQLIAIAIVALMPELVLFLPEILGS